MTRTWIIYNLRSWHRSGQDGVDGEREPVRRAEYNRAVLGWLCKVCNCCDGNMAADEGSVMNGDRVSQASSTEFSELPSTPLPLDADDRESCLTEDDEQDTPIRPSLRSPA